jgi:cytochrome c-type biogenesis protein CcmH
MLFWIVAVALALTVAGLLAWVMLRGSTDAGSVSDLDIYKDQLKEVDRDLERGVLSVEEAERVRTEVSRRLLEADRAATQVKQAVFAPRALTLGGGAAVMAFVIVGALALYNQLGAPGYEDLPIAKRIANAETARKTRPDQATAEAQFGPAAPDQSKADPKFLDLMQKLRATVAARPDDLRGQMLLSRNEASLGNFPAAYQAQAKVIELKGEAATSEDYSDLADLRIVAAGGYVSPQAEEALREALQRDQRNGPARYYTGLMLVQTGRPDLGFEIWYQLLQESRPEAPWVPPINAQIEQVAQMAGIRYTAPDLPSGAPGPSSADVAAAADMTPEQRTEMIRGMVAGLSERLSGEGGTPAEWSRLINAYAVLGEKDKARASWNEAQSVFESLPDALDAIRSAAIRAGVAE